MSPVWRLTLSSMIFEIALCSVSWGQGPTLDSNPTGAHFVIRGPVSLSGRTPLSLSDLPVGEYDYTVQGPGLAYSRGRFVRDGEDFRFQSWADPRAILAPPGFVHLMRKEPRGWYYLGAAVFSGNNWATSSGYIQDAKDEIASAETALAVATNPGEVSAAQVQLLEATARKDDESRIRNLWAGYFAAVWVGAGLEAWLLTPQTTVVPSGPGQFSTSLPEAHRWNAALRSVIAPGAGQRSLGRTTRATVFSSAVAATAAGAILAQRSFLEARRERVSAERRLEDAAPENAPQARLELETATSDQDSKSTLRWLLVGASAYLYVWNVIDAYFIGEQAEASASRLAILPTPSGIQVSMTLQFP